MKTLTHSLIMVWIGNTAKINAIQSLDPLEPSQGPPEVPRTPLWKPNFLDFYDQNMENVIWISRTWKMSFYYQLVTGHHPVSLPEAQKKGCCTLNLFISLVLSFFNYRFTLHHVCKVENIKSLPSAKSKMAVNQAFLCVSRACFFSHFKKKSHGGRMRLFCLWMCDLVGNME